MCDWKFWLPPDSKTTDKPNWQPIRLKPNFLFYPPISKLSTNSTDFIKKAPDIKTTFSKKKKKKGQKGFCVPTFLLSTPFPETSYKIFNV